MASLDSSIGLISCLNRRDELIVPSCPAESTRTGVPTFTVVAPKMFPIKQLLLTFAPELPIEITLLAVVTLTPALNPRALLLEPLILLTSAPRPIPTFVLPLVVLRSAPAPIAAFSVEKECPSADSGTEIIVYIAREREPPNRCVRQTAVDVEVQKSVLPFRRVEPGITSVWRRIYRLRVWQKSKAEECEEDSEQSN